MENKERVAEEKRRVTDDCCWFLSILSWKNETKNQSCQKENKESQTKRQQTVIIGKLSHRIENLGQFAVRLITLLQNFEQAGHCRTSTIQTENTDGD